MRRVAVAEADRRTGFAGRSWPRVTVALTAGSLVSVILLAPPADAPPIRALSWLIFVGSSVHVASTGWLFTLPAVRGYAKAHLTRCVWVPAGLIGGAAVVAALMTPAAFQWLLLPYFWWQFYHYQKQNVGMAALAAAALQVRGLGKTERWSLVLAGVATLGVLAADPKLVGLRVQLGWPWLRTAALAVFILAVASGVAALARRPAAARPNGYCAVYLTSLLFGLPAFVFASPYAAVGGMTVAHGLQYLLLIALIACQAGPPRPVRLALLANIALIGGALLSAASHLHNSTQPGRLLFGAYLGVVMVHFVIDAGIWRMRDPLARSFITQSLPFLPEAAARGGRQPAEPMTSSPPSHHCAVTDGSSTDIGCGS